MKRPGLFLMLSVCLVAWGAADEPARDVSKGYPETPAPFYDYSYPKDYDPTKYVKDSFKYYGPNDLWWKWNASQRRGRDMWIFWTAGNQTFYRRLQIIGGSLPVPISIDFFRLLDSRQRGHRFRDLGLMNEPNFKAPDKPNEYGLWMDEWDGEPDPYYPNSYYRDAHDLKKYWGEPTGILGLRKFKNPKFTKQLEDAWKANVDEAKQRYFANPGQVEPPYLVGITCAFCHIAFNPLSPPKDPESPRWENLAANIGNQYFDEGGLFFGRGRLALGDKRPVDQDAKDPYRTRGLGPDSFLWHYGATQQRGTSETSRFSYDFINNPNTINQIINVPGRPPFWETAPNGVSQPTLHVLKDGADSVGVPMALQRVYVNIGAESKYWLDHLFDPLTGRRQRPMLVDEMRLTVSPERKAELERLYHDDIYDEPFGLDWKYTEARIPDLIAYLTSYTPFHLRDARGFQPAMIDQTRMQRGKLVFADTCATCHSSKQPPYYVKENERRTWFREAVQRADFLDGNALTNDVRYSANWLRTNAQRAMATNAIDGDIWADVSSKQYKALPPIGRMALKFPLGPDKAIDLDYTPPGGGRGYYRTASLTSLWTSAPYLHNNSVGEEPLRAATEADIKDKEQDYLIVKGDLITDATAITVEGRLKRFEAAMTEMLWPERRIPKVKLTSADSGLTNSIEFMQQQVLRLVSGVLTDLVLDRLKAELLEKQLPPDQVAAKLAEFRGKVAEGLSKLLADVVQAKGAKKELLEETLIKTLATLLENTGKDLQIPNEVLVKVITKVEQFAKGKFHELSVRIPQKTPINLLLNQDISSLPFVVLQILKHKHSDEGKVSPELIKALLDLSECPDLVENHGHYFGTNLDPRGPSYSLDNEAKRDLIEYLKTL